MIKLLHWFQTNYPELKQELLACHHNFDDNDTNPYHVEGDCWSHTMLVCKIAELKGYARVIQVAALLHDIGKPKARKINPENNHVQFFGHEELSASMAKPLVKDLVEREILTSSEAQEVISLIVSHAFLYKYDENKLYEVFKNNLQGFKQLIELSYCDDHGRFSEGMGKSTLNIDGIVKKIEKNSY